MTLEELATWLDDFGLEVVQGNASSTDACRLRLWAAAEACREVDAWRGFVRHIGCAGNLYGKSDVTDAALSACKE
jgi:hypothetical protein